MHHVYKHTQRQRKNQKWTEDMKRYREREMKRQG